MRRELFVSMRHIMEPEFMKNMLPTSPSHCLSYTYEITLWGCRCAASLIFVHFDGRYVIFRWVLSVLKFLEFLPFSQTQLRELPTFSLHRGTEYQVFRNPDQDSFGQSSSFPVSTFILGF